jgi:hypothetical protein
MIVAILWVLTPYIPYVLFRRNVSPPSSGSKINLGPSNTAHWFLAGLIFDPENGGDMFFRHAGLHSEYTTLYLR